jgi:fibronectin-binding autotransporter adhesin
MSIFPGLRSSRTKGLSKRRGKRHGGRKQTRLLCQALEPRMLLTATPTLPTLNWVAGSDWINATSNTFTGTNIVNGGSNDASYMQTLFTDYFNSYPQGGPPIYFPPGAGGTVAHYDINTTLQFGANVSTWGGMILGAGAETEFDWTGTTANAMIQTGAVSDGLWQGIVFNGNGVATIGLQHNQSTQSSTNERFRQLEFEKFTQDGFYKTPNGIAMSQPIFDNDIFINDNTGIYASDSSDTGWSFTGCEFDNNAANGIALSNGSAQIRDSHFSDNGNGVTIGTGADISITGGQQGDSIRDNTSMGSAQFLIAQGGSAYPAITVQGNTISNWTNNSPSPNQKLDSAIYTNNVGTVELFDNNFLTPPSNYKWAIYVDGSITDVVLPNSTSGSYNFVDPTPTATQNLWDVSVNGTAYPSSLVYYETTPGALNPALSATQPFLDPTGYTPLPTAIYNVTSYSAIPNALTDQTSFFQAALTAAVADSTDSIVEVYIPAGTYNLASTLTIPSSTTHGTRLIFGGAGAQSTQIYWTGPAGSPTFSVASPQNITLQDLALYGNNQSNNGNNNSADISVTGATGSSSITLDGVEAYGIKGLSVKGLGTGDTVNIQWMVGTAQFIDSGNATIFGSWLSASAQSQYPAPKALLSASLSVPSTTVPTGFLGFEWLGLSGNYANATPDISISNSLSFTADLYAYNANLVFSLSGELGDSWGHISIQGEQLNVASGGTGLIQSTNYCGQIVIGPTYLSGNAGVMSVTNTIGSPGSSNSAVVLSSTDLDLLADTITTPLSVTTSGSGASLFTQELNSSLAGSVGTAGGNLGGSHQFDEVSSQFDDFRELAKVDWGVNYGFILAGDFDSVIPLIPSISPADGWADLDVGSPSLAGYGDYHSYDSSTGTWSVTGGGTGIASSSDQFNYAYESVYNSNETIQANISGLNPTANTSSAAGVMFRDSTSPSALFAAVMVEPYASGGSVLFQYRNSSGFTSTSVTGLGSGPVWVKLVQSGSTFTAYYTTSVTNGVPNWGTAFASATVSFINSTWTAGLAVSAGTTTATSTATFTNVSVTDVSLLPTLNWILGDGVSDPNSDWINVMDVSQVSVNGVTYPVHIYGDGIHDDTVSIQHILDAYVVEDGHPIYFPAGTYKISSTLTVGQSLDGQIWGGMIVGAGGGPHGTYFVWAGPSEGVMIQTVGSQFELWQGLVFNGQAIAAIGFQHADPIGSNYDSYEQLEFEHCTIYGFYQYADSIAGQIVNPVFYGDIFSGDGIGLSAGDYNDLSYAFSGCEFDHDGVGIHHISGSDDVMDTHFESNSIDMAIGENTNGDSIRDNTSLNSGQFLVGLGVDPFTVQGNTISSWTNTTDAMSFTSEEAELFDNTFQTPPIGAAQAIYASNTVYVVLSQNTCSGVTLINNLAPVEETIPAGASSGPVLAATQQFIDPDGYTLLPTAIYDVTAYGATPTIVAQNDAAFQNAIDAAAASTSPVAEVYVPAGGPLGSTEYYRLDKTLVIPNPTHGTHLIFGGAGMGATTLAWFGASGSTMISVANPQNVTIQDVSLDPSSSNLTGIYVTGGSGTSSITLDHVATGSDLGLWVNGMTLGDTVNIRWLQANTNFSNDAAATIFGTYLVSGPNQGLTGPTAAFQASQTATAAGTGFLGFDFLYPQGQSGAQAPNDYAVSLANSVSLTANFYTESTQNAFDLTGESGDPQGDVSIQGDKFSVYPSGSSYFGTQAINTNGYAGQIVIGPIWFASDNNSTNSTLMTLNDPISNGTMEDVDLIDNNVGTPLNITASGSAQWSQEANSGAAGSATVAGSTAPVPWSTTQDQEVAKQLDDFRRLASVDLAMNYGFVLPAGFSSTDVGSPPPTAHSATYNSTNNQWQVSGAGSGIAGSSDQFNYTSQNWTAMGTGSLYATLGSVASGQAGIMIRDSENANSEFAAVLENPNGTVQFESRTTNGGMLSSSSAFSASGGRIELSETWSSGNTDSITGYYYNGTSYTSISTVSITFSNSSNLVGLAVTSDNTAQIVPVNVSSFWTTDTMSSGSAQPISSSTTVLPGSNLTVPAGLTFSNSAMLVVDPGGQLYFGTVGTVSTQTVSGSGNIFLTSASGGFGAAQLYIQGASGSTVTFDGGVAITGQGVSQTVNQAAGNTIAFANTSVNDVTLSTSGTTNLQINGTSSLPTRFSNVTTASTLSGSGELAISGGTVTLTATNNSAYFSGAIVLQSGILAISNDAALGSGGGSSITFSGGTLQLTNYTTNSGLIFSAGQAVQLGVASSYTTTLSGSNNITGSSTLTYVGPGKLILSDTNTYTGGTNINSGQLQVAATENVGTSGPLGKSGTINFGGGTLQFSTSDNFDYSPRFSTAANQAYNIDTNGQSVTLSAALSSSGGTLTDVGAGTLTLGVNDSLASLSGTGTLALGATTLTLTNASGTFSGIITGGSTSGLKITGGTEILSGANTYTGATTLSGGILAITGDAAISSSVSGAGLNFSGGTLQFTNYTTGTTTTLTFANQANLKLGVVGSTITIPSGAISGSSGLTYVGPGTLILGGTTNNYSGATTLGGGVLSVSSDGALGNNSSTNSLIFTGGTLQTTTTGISDNRNVTLTSTGTIDVDGTSTDTFSGIFSGGGGLTISDSIGGGKLTLLGANTYSGATTVKNGTLVLGHGASLSASTTLTLGDSSANTSGVFQLGDSTNAISTTVASLSTAGTGIANAVVGGYTSASTLTVNNAGTDTYGGILGGAGSNQNQLALTKTSAGTLTLSGTNTYTGATTISGGVLAITSDAAVNNGTGGIAFPTSGSGGGTLQFNNYSSTNLPAFLNLANLKLGAATGAASTFSEAITGTSTLTYVGPGTLILTGANTYSGTGGTNINGGILSVASDGELGTSTGGLGFSGGTLRTTIGFSADSRAVTLNSGGGIIDVAGTNAVAFSGAFSGTGGLTVSDSVGRGLLTLNTSESIASLSGSAALALASGTTLTLSNASGTFSGTIQGAGGLKITGGIETLSGTNTYTGATTISGGVLAITSDAAVNNGTGGITFPTSGSSGGTLQFNNYNSTNLPAFLNLANLKLGAATGAASTLSEAITGTSALTFVGPGTLILTGANTYSGGTTLNGGTLSASADSNLGADPGSPTTNLTFAGGTLAATATFTLYVNRKVLLNSPGGSFDVASGQTLTVAGIISGSSTLTEVDTGTLILTNTETYTGATTITSATLKLGNGTTDGNIAASIGVIDNGTLDFTGDATFANDHLISLSGSGSVLIGGAHNINVDLTNASGTFSGVISGTGLFDVQGGAETLSGANTYTGGTQIGNGTTGKLIVSNAQNLGGLTSATININDGTLQTTSGMIIGHSVSVANTATIDTDGQTVTITGTVSGSGQLTAAGGGTLNLEGASPQNTYTGGTLIKNGTTVGFKNTGSFGAGASDSITIDATGGAIEPEVNSLTLTNAITLNGTGTVNTNAVGFTTTLSGAIGGTTGSSLAVTGPSTLVLSGINTYTGVTYINGGVLQVDSAETPGTSGPLGKSAAANPGSIVFGGGTLQYSAANQFDYSGRFSTAANQPYSIDTNGQSVTLATALTSSGGTLTVSDSVGTGTLTLGVSDSIASLSGSGKLALGATTLTLTNASGTFSGVIQGTGGLTINSPVSTTETLSGSNTYSGATTLTNGTLAITIDGAISSSVSGGGINFSGGTLQFNNYNSTLNASAFLNKANLNLGAAAGAASSLGSVIGGTSALTFAGPGTLILSGANTYSGGTTLSAGTLKVSADGNLGAVPGSPTTNLTFAGGTLAATASFTLNVKRNIVLNSPGGSFDVASGQTLTIAGIISGSSTLTEVDTGTLTLSGANTYTGATNIQNGTLALAATGALPSGTAVTLGSGTTSGILDLGGNAATVSGLATSGTGTSDIIASSSTSANTTLTFAGGSNPASTFSGIIQDSVNGGTKNIALTVTSGSLVLSGANTYTGGTNINGGVLQVAATETAGTSGPLGKSGTILFAGGTLQYSAANTFDYSGRFSTAASQLISIDTNGQSVTLGATPLSSSGGTLTKLGLGTLILTAANTYTGVTKINGGLLQVASAENAGISGPLGNPTTPANSIVFGGGTLQYSPANNFDYSSRFSTTASQPISIDTNGQSVTFATALTSSSGSLTTLSTLGTGTLTLSGANTYTGATTINPNATLKLSSTGSMLNSNGVTDNGTFDISLTSGASVKSFAGNGTVTLGAQTLTLTSASGAFSGNIGGTGGLTISSGTETLSATNTYTGTTTISGGVLAITSDAAINNGFGGILFPTSGSSGGTLQFNSYSSTHLPAFANLPNLKLGAAAGTGTTPSTLSEAITGSSILTYTGPGTLILTDNNSYSGATTISGGVLAITSDAAVNNGTGGIAFPTSGSSGGTLQFNNYNSTSLPTSAFLNQANLKLGAATGAASTLTTVIGGSSILTYAGLGTLILSGINTYTGGTNINGGVLQVDATETAGTSGPLGKSGTISFAGGTLQYSTANTFDYSGRFSTASQVISIDTNQQSVLLGTALLNTGDTLTKLGLGTLTLNIANTYTGGTNIKGGILSLGVANAISTSAGTITFGGGTLQLSTSDHSDYSSRFAASQPISLDIHGQTVSFSSALTGSGGSLTVSDSAGSGTLTLLGANTYTGATTVKSGTLVLGHGATLSASTTLTLGDSTANTSGVFQLGDSTAAVNTTVASLTAAGTGTANAVIGGNGSTSTLTVSNIGTDTYAGILGGTGTQNDLALTKIAGGTLTLGGINTYTGGTNINGGALSLGSSGAIGTSGTISFGGGTLQFSASNTTDYSSRFNTAANQAYRIDTNGQSVTLVTALTSSGGMLTKLGAGTLTLLGGNTYSGVTNINAGTLAIGNDAAINNGAGGINFNGGTLQFNGPNSGLNFSGQLAQLSVTSGGTTTFSGNITDNGPIEGSLTYNGPGTIILNGSNNTYSGGTSINSGVLSIASDGELGTGSLILGGTLQTTTGLSPDSRNITLIGSGATIDTDANADTFSGVISGLGRLTVSDSSGGNTGKLTLTGVNTYVGQTTIGSSSSTANSNVTLALSGAGSIANSNNVNNDAHNKLDISATTSGASVVSIAVLGTSTVLLGSQTLTLTDPISTNGFSGTIQGTGGFTVAGGMVVVTGTNTYSGVTTISGGVLAITSDAAINNGFGGIAFPTSGGNGGTLQFNNYNSTNLPTSAFANQANLKLGTAAGTASTLSEAITGSSALTYIGPGTLFLNDTNTFSGGTTITGGIIEYASTAAYGAQHGAISVWAGAGVGTDVRINDFSTSSDSLLNRLAASPTPNAGALLISNLDATTNLDFTSSSGLNLARAGLVNMGVGAVPSQTVTYTGTITPATSTYFFGAPGSGNLILANTNALTGSCSLSVNGGTLTLQSTNNYSATTMLNGGILAITSDNSLGTSSIRFNGGTLQFNSNYTSGLVFSAGQAVKLGVASGVTTTLGGTGTNNISGGSSLTYVGPGTLILAGNNNNYTGGTTLNAGVLSVSTNSDLGTAPSSPTTNLTFASGTLAATTGFTLNVSRSIVLSSAGTFDVASGQSLTIAGAISGAGSLTEVDTGTLILINADTYTGATTITSGTLQLGNGTADGSIASSSGVTDNGTLDISSLLASGASVKSLAGSGSVTLNTKTLTVTSASGTFSGNISGGSASGLKITSGTETLNATNSYTGATTLSGGTLAITSDGAISSSVSGTGLTFGGGTLQFNYSSTYTSTSFSFANQTNVKLGVTAGGAFTLNGNITGSSSVLTYVGPGALVLGGTNNFGGGTNITGGIIEFASTTAYGAQHGAISVSAGAGVGTDVALTASTGTSDSLVTRLVASPINNAGALLISSADAATNLDFTTGTYAPFANMALGAVPNQSSVTYTGTITPGTSTYVFGVSGSGNLILANANALTGSRNLQVNGGTLTLQASNNYSGTITLSGGTLSVANDNELGSDSGSNLTLIFSGGTLQTTSGISDNRNATLDSTGIIDVDGTSTNTFSGVFSGSGGLTVSDSSGASTGKLTLSGINTYSGTTTMNSGVTLALSAGGIANSSVTDNGTLDISSTTSGASVASVSGGGTVTLGSRILTLTNAGGNFSGTITGTGGLTIADGGTEILSGRNTYTGTTSINGGTLNVGIVEYAGTNGPLGNGGTISFSGGTLQYSTVNNFDYSSRFSTAANQFIRIDTNGQNVTFATALTSSGGTLTKLGLGTLILTATNIYTGATTLNGGILSVANDSALGNNSGTNSLTFNGGTLLTTGTGFSDSRAVTLSSGGTIDVDGATDTFSGVFSGSGGLTVANSSTAGTGTLTLSGTSNTYNNGTTANGATLNFAAAGAVPSAGTITVNNGGNLQFTASAVLGSNSILLNSGGALDLTGSGPFTTIAGWLGSGKIQTSSSGAVAITTNNNENLNFATTYSSYNQLSIGSTGGNWTYSGTLIPGSGGYLLGGGGGTLTVSSSLNVSTASLTTNGSIALSGINSYTGTTINAGVFSGTLPASGNITINAGGALAATGANPVATWLNTNRIVTSSTGALAITGNDSENLNFATTYSSYSQLSIGSTGGNWTFSGTLTPGIGGYLLGGGDGTLTVSSALNVSSAWLTVNGSVTLAATNTYTGTTTINPNATLKLGNGTDGNIAASSGVTDNGTLDITGDSTLTDDHLISLSGSGSVLIGGAHNINVDLTNASGTFSGVISGAGLFDVQGGTEMLSGANTYTGGTQVGNGAAATLIVSSANNLGIGNTININSGTLRTTTGMIIGHTVSLANTATIDTHGQTVTITGAVSGSGQLIATSGGTLNLNPAVSNTYSGGTLIENGTTVGFNKTGSFGTGTITIDTTGGAVNAEMGGVTLTNAITLNGPGTFNTNAVTSTLSGAISGTGSLSVAGGGTLVLTGTVTSATLSPATGTTLQVSGSSTKFDGVTLNGNLTLNASAVLDVVDGLTEAAGVTITQGTGALIDMVKGSATAETALEPWIGDGTMYAQISGFNGTTSGLAGGVTFMDSTVSGAAMASVTVSEGGTINFQWIPIDGGTLQSSTPVSVSAPVWLKLVRSGSSVSAYYSTSSATSYGSVTGWTQIGSTQTITFSNSPIWAGLTMSDTSGAPSTDAVNIAAQGRA